MPQIQFANQIERRPLSVGKFRRRQQIEDRRSLVAQSRRLKRGRQEPVRIIGGAAERAGVEQHHVARQILVLGAEAVRRPRAEARLAHADIAGVKLVAGGRVIVRVGLHRVDEAQVVDVLRDVRKQFADPHAGLAVLAPRIRAGQQLVFAAMRDVREFRSARSLAAGKRASGWPLSLCSSGL